MAFASELELFCVKNSLLRNEGKIAGHVRYNFKGEYFLFDLTEDRTTQENQLTHSVTLWTENFPLSV